MQQRKIEKKHKKYKQNIDKTLSLNSNKTTENLSKQTRIDRNISQTQQLTEETVQTDRNIVARVTR